MNTGDLLNMLVKRSARHLITSLIAVAFVAGCAGNDEQDTVINDLAEAYEDALSSVQRGNYRRGIQVFEAIRARFPFSDIARQVQLDLMYAYYKAGQKEQAIEAADTFMRENPIHQNVDYALYIKGLTYFEDEGGFLERRFKKDVTERPPKDVQESKSRTPRFGVSWSAILRVSTRQMPSNAWCF